jgi:hypothetical protein
VKEGSNIPTKYSSSGERIFFFFWEGGGFCSLCLLGSDQESSYSCLTLIVFFPFGGGLAFQPKIIFQNFVKNRLCSFTACALLPTVPKKFVLNCLSLVHAINSVGDFSSPGKCDRLNDMQKTWNCLLLKSDSILLCATSLVYIRQKHKIADQVARLCEPGFNSF